MKSSKLILAGLLAMGLSHVASAVTEIRLTGSTAFRSATINSIQAILNPDYVWGGNPSATGGANQQVFVGTTKVGGIQVIIKTAWAGSAGGIFAVATPAPAVQPFIIDPTGVSFSPAAGTVGGIALTHAGVAIPNASTTETHLADVALSDGFQATTPYAGVPLKDTIVGVVPFEWVKGAYSPDGGATTVAGGYPGVTNLTLTQAQALIGGGIALNQLTGNPADNSFAAFMVGRDHDSGTRIGYVYDSQYLGCIFGAPTDGFKDALTQYIPNGASVGATQFDPQSAGSGLITSLDPWPLESVVGETRPGGGQEGFFSGGNVKNVLNRPADTIGSGVYVISFLGMGDANGVNPDPTGVSYTDGAGVVNTIHPSLNALTFQGVYPGTAAHPFAPPYVNIQQGNYTAWGYEHYFYATSLAGSLKTVADQISAQLTTEADFGGVGVLLSSMNCHRDSDGGPIASP